MATAALAVLGAAAVYAQDKYLLKSTSGIAFSDFKGHEDWAVVSSARSDEVLKVIVAKSDHDQCLQGRRSGQRPTFPGWNQDREAPVEAEEEHGGPFVVDVPDVFTRAFVMEKDSRRFPKSGGWDTRCSTTNPHRMSSRPIQAPQTAETLAIRP
jgi:hypothetical protein